jgi:hypothetical protein
MLHFLLMFVDLTVYFNVLFCLEQVYCGRFIKDIRSPLNKKQLSLFLRNAS